MTNHPFNTSPPLWEKLKPLARQMRREPTPDEDALWQLVRNRKIGGAKFRRQYAIERFIVDFCCLEAHLIIEVDGEVHQYTVQEDAVRQAFLESQGYTVLRFVNEAVLNAPLEVVGAIAALVSGQVRVGDEA